MQRIRNLIYQHDTHIQLLSMHFNTKTIKNVHSLFVANNVSSFAANIRKLVYSLWRSLNASDNVLINAALRSDLIARSPVFRRWHNILF